MDHAIFLLLRRSLLRWLVLPGSVLCLLLVAARVRGAESAIVAGAEASYAILVWAPAGLLGGYLAVRQTGPLGDLDLLVFQTSRGSRVRRTGWAVAVPCAWWCLGWLAYWSGCTVLARSTGTSLPTSMALNGISLTLLTTTAGALLASTRSPAWLAAGSAAVAYAGLAVWFYVPETPGSLLYSPYAPAFLANAVPNPAVLLTQLGWAVGACLLAVAWRSRLLPAAASAIVLSVLAATCTALAASLPYVLARSGHVELRCSAVAESHVCWWADHPQNRAALANGVALARELAAGTGITLPSTITESDYGSPWPSALPAALRSGVVTVQARSRLPATAVAATVLTAGLKVSAHCNTPSATSMEVLGVPGLIEYVVTQRRSPESGRPLSVPEIRSWLGQVAVDVPHCRATPAP